jgi:hypothetical protein
MHFWLLLSVFGLVVAAWAYRSIADDVVWSCQEHLLGCL